MHLRFALAFFIASAAGCAHQSPGVTVSPPPPNAPPNAPPEVVLEDAGSTNRQGFRVVVHADGSTTWTRRAGIDSFTHRPAPETSGEGQVPASLAAKLFDALAAARPLRDVHFDACAKSASFGSTMSLASGQERVDDVSCSVDADPKAQAIHDAATAVLSLPGVWTAPTCDTDPAGHPCGAGTVCCPGHSSGAKNGDGTPIRAAAATCAPPPCPGPTP